MIINEKVSWVPPKSANDPDPKTIRSDQSVHSYKEPWLCTNCNRCWDGNTNLNQQYLPDWFPKRGCSEKICKLCRNHIKGEE